MEPAKLSPLTQSIRSELERHRNQRKAAGAQAYMKSEMPYYGVSMPDLRKITDQVFQGHPISMAADWRRLIAELWDNATHREERYAAIELAAHPTYQRFISLALLPLYRRMIQEGAWWDVVDALAHRVSVLLRTYPDRIKPTLRAWSRHENIWLRRVAIIAQVGFRENTDLVLLYDCIEPSLASKEFFLRKAIGWALRELAKDQPDQVAQYLSERRGQLSPLSKKEAEKGLTQSPKRPQAKKKTAKTK